MHGMGNYVIKIEITFKKIKPVNSSTTMPRSESQTWSFPSRPEVRNIPLSTYQLN